MTDCEVHQKEFEVKDVIQLHMIPPKLRCLHGSRLAEFLL